MFDQVALAWALDVHSHGIDGLGVYREPDPHSVTVEARGMAYSLREAWRMAVEKENRELR